MTNTRAPARILPRAFPGITPDEVQEMVSLCRVNSYPAGAVLCRENMLEHTFYMILDGEAEVTKVINEREARLLKILGAGEFFGEMALIHNAPRAATVTARTPLVVLELDKASFDRVLKRSSSIALAMVKEISRRLRQNDEMAIEDLRLRAGELAEAYQKLAEQELARREFLSRVAHELRTPLTAASGYLQLLQSGALSGEPLQAALSTVARNIERIVALVNDILFLQEIELVLPDFQAVDMAKMARAVVEQYSQRAQERGVRFVLEGEQDVPPVAGDPKSLERALTALIDNAIKFSPRGGDVEIRFEGREGELVLSVKDHGIGIAPEAQARIFDRFYHLDRSGDDLFGGLGLGLAITRQVMQQHRGGLKVESTPGRGSTFTLSIPLWRESETQAPPG